MESGSGGNHATLSELLSQQLKQQIVSWSAEPLDSGGQHFSCDVTRVRVRLRGQQTDLHLVVKQLPGTEHRVEINSKVGFQKEAAFYQLAAPAYCKQQQQYGITSDSFPKLIGASDQLIILQDLKFEQFSSFHERLDEARTKLVLTELAKFHATGVALKLSDPKSFFSKFGEVMVPGLRNAENPKRDEVNKKFRLEISTMLESIQECKEYVKAVDKVLEEIDKVRVPTPQEPYATMLHNDLWIGNIIFKYTDNNTQIKLKFLDFQNTIYNSPARDLVYFLFTSVDKNLLSDFESLVSFYHCAFLDFILKFGLETKDFTLGKLLEEIQFYGPTKMKHIILLYKTLSSAAESDCETMFKKHLQELVMMFRERNWLNL